MKKWKGGVNELPLPSGEKGCSRESKSRKQQLSDRDEDNWDRNYGPSSQHTEQTQRTRVKGSVCESKSREAVHATQDKSNRAQYGICDACRAQCHEIACAVVTQGYRVRNVQREIEACISIYERLGQSAHEI